MGKLKLIFVPCNGNNFRPKVLDGDFLFYFFIVLVALKLLSFSFIFHFPDNVFFAEITKSSLFQMANAEREFSGLPVLRENLELDKAAYLKAKDIIEKDYFSHYNPEGLSPWYWFKAVGYDYKSAGENLAIGFLDSEEVHKSWLASPSHKKNILNSGYQEMGISVVKGDFQGNEVNVVVQLFGSPKVSEAGTIQAVPQKEEVVQEKEENVAGEESVPDVAGAQGPAEEEIKEILSAAEEEKVEKNLAFNLWKFMSLNFFDLLQKFIYISLVLMILFLAINVLARPDIQHPDLIFKGLGFIALLIVFIFLDKEIILGAIPHNLIIQ